MEKYNYKLMITDDEIDAYLCSVSYAETLAEITGNTLGEIKEKALKIVKEKKGLIGGGHGEYILLINNKAESYDIRKEDECFVIWDLKLYPYYSYDSYDVYYDLDELGDFFKIIDAYGGNVEDIVQALYDDSVGDLDCLDRVEYHHIWTNEGKLEFIWDCYSNGCFDYDYEYAFDNFKKELNEILDDKLDSCDSQDEYYKKVKSVKEHYNKILNEKCERIDFKTLQEMEQYASSL